MNDYTVKILKNYFSLYYEDFNYDIKELTKREIAFSTFDSTSMMRHVSFQSKMELKDALKLNPPRHFFYSSAYYSNPSKEDLSETWIGSDLIFDIDADHLPGSDKMTKKQMLDETKKEVYKLIMTLEDDFGVKSSEMELVFSGSRGYHIHVYDLFNQLNSSQRREIVDYITGKCLSKLRILKKSKWSEKIREEEMNLRNKIIELFKKTKDKEILFEGEKFARSRNFPSQEEFDKITKIAIRNVINKYGAVIDEAVTIDIHRLIRTPMSLHGKSGLIARPLKIEELEKFNPFQDSIPDKFKNIEAKVRILRDTKDEFNYDSNKISEGVTRLPLYSAIYLALNNEAEFLQ